MDLSKLLANVKNKRAEIESRKNSTTTKKIPGGKSRWRILPGWRKGAPEVFSHEFGQHWVKDENGKPIAIYVCDRITFGQSCDICNIISEAMKSTKDDKVLQTFKDMRAASRILVNAVQLTGEGADVGKAGLLPLPNSVFEAYLTNLETYAEEGVNLLDLREGRDIIINKTGSGVQNTKYEVGVAPSSSKVNDGVMDSIVDIDAYINQQKASGISKGVAPLNGRVGSLLSISGPSASKSLLSGSSTSSMLASTQLDDEIPHLGDKPSGTAELSNADIEALLNDID